MRQQLHLILSCTSRKRSSEIDYPRLRDVKSSVPARRADIWSSLVDARPRDHLVADLYAGEYWQSGLTLARFAEAKYETHTWVISAGLGLIASDDRVPMYAATLASGHADSVVTNGTADPRDARHQWWDALSRWEGPGRTHIRRLSDLAANNPAALIVLCASRQYIDAITYDLQITQSCLHNSETLMIFSSGPPLPHLSNSWITVPGSLRLLLGGSHSSTSVRTARETMHKLEPTKFSAPNAQDVVAKLARSAGPLPSYDRNRQTDEEVLAWLVEYTAEVPVANKTNSLRRFRDSGNACEQSRFGRLFAEAKESDR